MLTQEDLKIERLKARLSQKQLAELIDVAPATLAQWEQWRNLCSPTMLKRIELTLSHLPVYVE